MKKLLFVLTSTIILIGTTAAQSQREEQKTRQDAVIKNEHLLMKDGKMLQIIDGKEMQMQNHMTLKNGTMIHPDGSYQLKNGKQGHLHNGHCMDMSGKKYRSQHMLQKRMMGRHNMNMTGHGQNMMGGHH